MGTDPHTTAETGGFFVSCGLFFIVVEPVWVFPACDE